MYYKQYRRNIGLCYLDSKVFGPKCRNERALDSFPDPQLFIHLMQFSRFLHLNTLQSCDYTSLTD